MSDYDDLINARFRLAIEKIATSTYGESVGKAQLSKIINQWRTEVSDIAIKYAIQEILSCFAGLPEWVGRRFTYVPGYYYEEGGSRKYLPKVMGWIDEEQVEPEPLPLRLHYQQFNDERYCEVLDWGYEGKGFAAALDLPVVPHIGSLAVVVPVESLRLFVEHGYASPCQIQWVRRDNQRDSNENGYYVTRSIIPHGFWCAWKWWSGARDWYYEHRPELFEEEEIWGGKDVCRYEPDNSYSVVLGGLNKEFWERNKFYIEE